MTNAAILWRRLDQPGHEAARLSTQDGFWRLAGTANFIYNGQPCRLDYRILCDKTWQTRSGRVAGWVGPEPVEVDIAVDVAGRWWLNGTEITAVAGCLDLDLNFSPSTNLLPIRRLGLAVGQAAAVKAAWLRFPSFTLEPLEQTYHRLAEATYRYESAGGKFVRDLPVNAAGFVTTYPDFWELEAMT
ncbi:MAG TPA: putative glycolipid-binding domain-containing protein [Anaerolineae bacterium]|nr:putative glycolipid-binding domain-containing protein [Anaerolineae bacterium]MCB0225935.1 putative glycolipid-binding domain-containing protein [Anaerolineae bacterium]HRV90681.1 putative glycolipid-binding domain-containing protein [Anaerolineae bacterium]